MKDISRALAIVVGLVVVAACSDSTSTSSDTVAATNTPTTDAVVETTVVVDETTTTTVADITDVVNTPGTGEFVGALEDVADLTCEREDDGWRVTGTATNPTTDAVDYRIYISLLNGAAVTRALVETELLAVAASASATFDELIPLPDQDLRCVLRVERHVPAP